MVHNIDMKFLGSVDEKSNFDLLVINGGTGNASLLAKLAKAAKHVMCVDGGAIALHCWAPKIRPEFIAGDLDSFTGTEAEKYYRGIDIPVIKLWDQERTDIDKTLTYLKDKLGGDRHVVIWCNFDGSRVDHEFSNYNTLLKHSDHFLSLVLVSQSSAITVIKKGDTILSIDDCLVSTEKHQNYCGLIPLFGPVRNIETKGLKWDCGKDFSRFQFGRGMLSTSNEIIAKEVMFKTSDPFLLTMTISSSKL